MSAVFIPALLYFFLLCACEGVGKSEHVNQVLSQLQIYKSSISRNGHVMPSTKPVPFTFMSAFLFPASSLFFWLLNEDIAGISQTSFIFIIYTDYFIVTNVQFQRNTLACICFLSPMRFSTFLNVRNWTRLLWKYVMKLQKNSSQYLENLYRFLNYLLMFSMFK